MQNTLTLHRREVNSDGIVGELHDDSGAVLAVTMEPNYDGAAKVPAGTYICQRGRHQLKNGAVLDTFEVTNVPGHTGILFHTGNWQIDSDGCVLLGRAVCQSTKGCMLTNSRLTFERFMDALDGQDQFTLVVRNVED